MSGLRGLVAGRMIFPADKENKRIQKGNRRHLVQDELKEALSAPDLDGLSTWLESIALMDTCIAANHYYVRSRSYKPLHLRTTAHHTPLSSVYNFLKDSGDDNLQNHIATFACV